MQRFLVQSLNERRYAETFAVFLARSQEYPLMIEHLTSIIQSRPHGIQLLDVGAGTGFPIRELLTHSGITVGAYVGIEPNPDHAHTLKTALASLPLGRFDVITDAFNPTTAMPGEFDLVLFSHSLYGMADPVGCFLHGATFLKADGLALAYLQGPYGDYALYKLFEPLFDRDSPSLENGMSSHELLMGLRDRGAQPTVRFLPATIDLTGLFDPEQSHQLSELLSFCLLLEFESVPAPLRDDIIQYLRAACFERDGRLLWLAPTAAVTLLAGRFPLTKA